MDTVTRRRFLLTSGVTAATALAAGATTISMHDLLAAGVAGRPEAGGDGHLPVLVLVTLYGGNDGLNTVVPAGDPAYQKARPDLAYAEHEVLPLADGLGLNPAMKGLKAQWDRRRLAVVRGVSYPKPDHSHFRSMAIWQTASPETSSPTGWLGRWLDDSGGDPLKAVAVGTTLPPLLAGSTTAGAVLPVDADGGRDSGTLPAARTRAVTGLSAPSSADDGEQARAARSYHDLLRVDAMLDRLPAAHPGQQTDPRTGESPLAAQLAVVSRCINAGAPPRAYSVSLGGFDTHADEKGTQSRLLGQLDTAVSGFLKTVGPHVVVAIYSEFGRRVAANAGDGTDHGTAGPVLIAGGPVKGGFYGDEPSLTTLDDGDLAVTTDFRDVYATLLHKVLGADPGRVLGGHDRTLAFL